jgi:hypothetical protein
MNIYVRKNNNDLLKYLTEAEIASLTLPSDKIEVAPVQSIELYQNSVNVVERGIINIVSPNDGKTIMTISAGEIFGEEKLFQKEWSLSYQSETQTVFRTYHLDFSKVSDKATLRAKIQAAINDSLSEKLIRLTHKPE